MENKRLTYERLNTGIGWIVTIQLWSLFYITKEVLPLILTVIMFVVSIRLWNKEKEAKT